MKQISDWWYGSGRPERRGGALMEVGRWGEKHAVRALRRKGHRILGRNVRIAGGELDVVTEAPDGVTIVVVEVKAGKVWRGHRPADRVDRGKRKQLRRLGNALRRAKRWQHRPMRWDVVAVEGQPGEKPTIVHHVGVV